MDGCLGRFAPAARVAPQNFDLNGFTMHCYNCSSPNVRKLSIIVREGTSEVAVNATIKPTWGVGKKHTVVGKQTVQTALAKQCAAPSAPSMHTVLALVPAFLAAFQVGVTVGSYFHSFWIGLLALVAAFAALLYAWEWVWLRFLGGKRKMADFGAAIDRWRRSWLCHQCGMVSIE